MFKIDNKDVFSDVMDLFIIIIILKLSNTYISLQKLQSNIFLIARTDILICMYFG